ncbi:MAG: sulfatase [Geminicoccaceae bacterium]
MTKSPNILWFCTDQQRFDTIGALGNAHVSTPVIDGLVKSGTAFTHAYCQSPICTPSRASFLSGLYPSSVGLTRNGNDYFPLRVPLVTKRFSDAGYRCGNIGKLHLASPFGRMEPRTDDGYEFFAYSHAPRDNWPEGHDYASWVKSQGAVLAELTDDPAGVPVELHQTTWCANEALRFIDSADERPWLLTVNVYDPHPPFNPPDVYRRQFDPASMPGPHFRESDIEAQRRLSVVDFQSEASELENLDIDYPVVPAAPGTPRRGDNFPRDIWTLQAAYYAMIKLIDDQLGRILDRLGDRRNTIVLFTSDHGESLGDHGLIEKGCRFYEGLVRVPLIFSWPGRIEASLISDALVELMDKPATLLDLAGLQVPDYMQSRSMVPILTGDKDPHHHRDFVRSEYFDALDLADASMATMYRDRSHKLVVYHGHDLGELFDLEADPWEHQNLWDSGNHQALKLDLMKRSFDAAMYLVDRGPRRIGPF